MKTVPSPETPGHKSRRKVRRTDCVFNYFHLRTTANKNKIKYFSFSVLKASKPMMEKRRRERINSSLEALRLLMLENTRNEKLRNPKVEKAEILESVVDFLKKEKDHRAARKASPEEQGPAGGPHRSYHDGMRSCLLRVSQFIASKSLELEEANALQASLKLSGPLTAVVAPGDVPAALSPQRLVSQGSETRQTLSSASVPDPVWRPWPK
uniref:BHLH domain-containing protein n=1 Tax=Xiphophorus couchianus TaxID=32473 RepID=A0A3B5L2G6_9TELE